MIFVTENANFAPSGDEEKVTVNVNGTVKVTGDLGDNLKFDGEGAVKLANENNVEKNGENITKAFAAGAKNVELASDATLKAESETIFKDKFTIDEGVTFTTEKGAHFTDNGQDSEVAINGTWKVEGEIRDLNGCTFGDKSMIELASQTDTQNGKSLVVCTKVGVPNIKLDNDAKLTSDEKIVLDQAQKEVNLDLNNHKVSNDNGKRIAEVESGKTLTISNGTINSQTESGETALIKTEGSLKLDNVTLDSKGYGILVKGTSGVLEIDGGTFSSNNKACISTTQDAGTNAKLTIKNATITSTASYAVATNGTNTTVDLTMEGCKVTSNATTCSAIFLPAKGSAKLTNCKVTGATAVETVGLTKLDLLGTTKLTATLEAWTSPSRTNGLEPSGSALLIVSHGSYSKGQDLNVYIGEEVEFIKNERALDADGIEVYEQSGNAGISNVYLKTKKSSISAKQSGLSGCTLHTQANVEYSEN